MNQNLESRINEALLEYKSLCKTLQTTKASLSTINDEYTKLKDELALLDRCKPIIDNIIEKFSSDLVKNLENLISLGLKKVFYDRNYSVTIEIIEKRNSKCAEIYLKEDDNSIKLSSGTVAGGILVVIGFIIRAFYVVNLDIAKYIFLDEQFTQISDQYIEPFMSFIKELCQQTELSLVLITHDTRFLNYADRIYTANQGKYTLKE